MTNDQLSVLAQYYDKQDEMVRECLLALKQLILSVNDRIVHTRKFRIPFFYYNGYKLAFLWVHRKRIILGLVQDRKAFANPKTTPRRDRVSTFTFKPDDDLPMETIRQALKKLLDGYNEMLAV